MTKKFSSPPQKDPGRPDAIEEIINRLILHRFAIALVKLFAALGLHPNWVSFMGFLAGWGASYCYLQSPTMPQMAVYGFIAMICWHILDGSDGKLARFTGKTSAIGKVIDGIADYAVFIVVYIALMILMWDNWGWMGVALGVASGFSHALQSARYEAEREFYNSFILDNKSSGSADTRSEGGIGSWLGRLQNTYEKAQSTSKAVQLTNLLQKKPEDEQIQLKKAFAPLLEKNIHLWSVMCANYRTILIFIGVYNQLPALYFLIEVSILNIILVLLSKRTKKLYIKLETVLQKK